MSPQLRQCAEASLRYARLTKDENKALEAILRLVETAVSHGRTIQQLKIEEALRDDAR